MIIDLQVTGTNAMLMHNERLSDTDYEGTKRIKEITAKRTNQTDEDRAAISWLEWLGGLYLDEMDKKTIVMPTKNIVRCLREAATMTKEGKKIVRAISPTALSSPLHYDGPKIKEAKDLRALYDLDVFVDRRQVKVNTGRVKRTRPLFPAGWSFVAQFMLMPDVLDYDRFQTIAEMAGKAVGLGDARILGYGRFQVDIRKVAA